MLEEKEGVMRNAMTTRAPCGANNTCLMSEWVSGFEEKEGVMRNAMTTRAPCGAKNTCLMKK